MGKKLTAFIVFIALIVSLCACGDSATNKNTDGSFPLNVHYIDVGQGDCILLNSNDSFVLIDAGEKEYGETVCEYLSDCGVKTIDYVIATHPHSDHCGGLKDVIDTFACENFITTETDQQTKVWLDVLYAVDENNVNYLDAKVGDTYTFGECSFEIMGPYSDNYDDYNDYSVIVKAKCGDTSFLFTGDAEERIEKEMIENGADLSADVLKVSHHGSYTSSSELFVDEVNPSYAVIMCGKNNEYGHPHKETLNSLNSRGVNIYRTDLMGTIIAHSDGNEISFEHISENDRESLTTSQQSTSTENASEISVYIGNKSSKIFHYSDCNSVKKMKDENKVSFESRSDAVSNGYQPCKNCNP